MSKEWHSRKAGRGRSASYIPTCHGCSRMCKGVWRKCKHITEDHRAKVAALDEVQRSYSLPQLRNLITRPLDLLNQGRNPGVMTPTVRHPFWLV